MELVLNEPLKSWLQVTQSCNLRCRQCYGDCDAHPGPEEMSRSEYTALIKEMADSGVIEVFVEGGEPLNRPDVLDVLAELTPHVMTRVRTNATLLTPDAAARLKAIGVGEVYVDVLGATAATHDWHTRAPGSFDRTVQGLKNAQAAGLPVSLLIIMTRRNVDELQQVLEMADDLGVPRVGVLRLYPLGRARTQWKDLALRLPDQMVALDALQVPETVHLMTSWHPKDGNCCWQNSRRGRDGSLRRLRLSAGLHRLRQRPRGRLAGHLERPHVRAQPRRPRGWRLRGLRGDTGVLRRLPVHRLRLHRRLGRPRPVLLHDQRRDRCLPAPGRP